jgi:hypothetical protein
VGKPALCSINARTNIDRLTRRSVGISVGAVSNELIHAAARILATRDDFERVIRQWLLQCEADELTGEETLAEVTYHARAQEQNNRLRRVHEATLFLCRHGKVLDHLGSRLGTLCLFKKLLPFHAYRQLKGLGAEPFCFLSQPVF